jgi:Nucleotide-binding protein implicated in inhibition of septum formation
VAGEADGRPVLGVDTTVALEGRIYAKPADEGGAAEMLGELAGRTHAVVSGLCLNDAGVAGRRGGRDARHLPPADAAGHRPLRRVGRVAGARRRLRDPGLGAGLVERVEGDYLNIVGLPGALLVRLLAEHFPGVYGFG